MGRRRAVVLGLLLTLALAAGCGKSGGETAGFEAAPPPATSPEGKDPAGQAPAGDPKAAAGPTEAPPDPKKAELPGGAAIPHIYGDGSYPCSGHAVCDEPAPADHTLSIAEGGAEHIDPGLVSESAGMLVAVQLFEGLVQYPPQGTEAVPAAAESWTISEDGKTYTFVLRKDAKWSNGRTVTAHDFVYAWTRKLRPETASKSAEHHFFIKNAEAFNAGKITDEKQLGFRALDDFTLEVELKSPTPFWLHYVKTAHYGPVPREAVEKHGADWTRPENIVTNGPYVLTAWAVRDRMVLEKSKTYHGHNQVRIPRAVVFHSESMEDNVRRYEAGEIHWFRSGVPPEKVTQYVKEKRPDFFIDPLLAYYYYAFRLDRPPFDNLQVRRAINMAIDKERLVEHITRGKQRPADGPVPLILAEAVNYPKPEGEVFDPAKAKALLAEAGYPGGAGLPPVTLIFNTYESHRKIAEFVQRSLKDHLGIEVAIENMEWKSLLKQLHSHDFQMARFGWVGTPDPYGFLKPFQSTSENNVMGYKNAEVDQLLETSLATRDHDERMKILSKVEAIVQRDMPIAPIYYYTRTYMKKPYLRGFEPELNDTHLFHYMYFASKDGQ